MSARHSTLIVAGLLVAGSTAQAQGRRPSAPARQPQIAGIAPSPNTSRPPRDGRDARDDRRRGDGDDDRRGDGHRNRDGYRMQDGVYGWVPAVIGNDGRVWVNLGYGYEQVARTCDVPFGGYASGYSDAPAGYTPPNYAPPSYSAPTYNAPSYPAAGSSGAISQPLPDPTSHPVPDPSSHPVPGMARVPGVAPAPGAGTVAQFSYPPRDHRATASCYASGPQGRPAVLWH